jgi:acetolactate synthase-1/2/3 large subunit
MKYSDQFILWLKELGYTHCFFVAGGNIMHLVESASKHMKCVPVVHEVTAGIAVEYFNESNLRSDNKAFALVTAGPGLTNILTAMAGAYLESRELLVVGGQVKSTDLNRGDLRQLGIQEVDGISIAKNFAVDVLRIEKPLPKSGVIPKVLRGSTPRKGPVFIEFCLDAQGAEFADHDGKTPVYEEFPDTQKITQVKPKIDQVTSELKKSKRPVLLIGGGVDRSKIPNLDVLLKNLRLPVMTTWNGTDRISSDSKNYMGRPNTWGQRYSNVLIQQSDFVIAIGTRLGLQQTGFNWQEFIPNGKIAHIDIDEQELKKPNPRIDFPVCCDANTFLLDLTSSITEFQKAEWGSWLDFCNEVKKLLPLSEKENTTKIGFINPYDFYLQLSTFLKDGDTVIPSSSGAAETVAMQALEQKSGVTVITSKGLASMGYGLGGAIGSAFKSNGRVFHLEGDGGFAQNLQDLGTVAINNLNIKIFIFSNGGYASIKMTQKSYFNGHYVGCDEITGLGLPQWEKLFNSFDIPVMTMDSEDPFNNEVLNRINLVGPQAFIVSVDSEQTYFPKITSQLKADGSIVSNPLHIMTPELSNNLKSLVFKFIN